ncbi:MAG: type II secretion system GspH family protein [Planctomycetaceae bacterium]|jgi:prepilin-type N-terminal cleavage/methylation domain-containing protein|nr:type II secretion system GspH family protein [Planctomycetaceae bacterium]
MFANQKQKGMTLIELVIVLGILAALAGSVLTMTASLNDRARYETTRRRLDEIGIAIVGSPTEPEASRFLNDMGRLPIQKVGDGKALSELWECNRKYPGVVSMDYNIGTVANPIWRPITLNAGWRGPYIHIAGEKFYDGFGWEFYTGTMNANADWEDNTIDSVGTYGADGKEDKDDEEEDTSVEWQNKDDIRIDFSDRALAELTVQIHVKDGSGWTSPTNADVQNVVVFSPYVDENGDAYIRQTVATKAASAAWAKSDDDTWFSTPNNTSVPTITKPAPVILTEPNELTFYKLTPGIRKLLVYGTYGDDNMPKESGVVTIKLQRGSNMVNIYLR